MDVIALKSFCLRTSATEMPIFTKKLVHIVKTLHCKILTPEQIMGPKRGSKFDIEI
jgi:hypothetical protein